MSDDRRTAVAYVSCFFRPDPKLPEDENQAKFEKRVQAELKEMARLREVAELCRR